ncbi:MAG TPA: hypothetical protein VE326_14720 [Candidatus Binatia bacterium]|jgi:hypothetical protein|nr:hypothetical protein [Candidatus Binatia bacterium]
MIGRFGRTVRDRARGGAILLLLASLFAAPGLSRAKPYPEDPTPFPEGDPTADDQPSPTPKKSAGFTSHEGFTVHQSTLSGRRLPFGGRMTWDLYLRILSRLILR